jgi:hypothetical protein
MEVRFQALRPSRSFPPGKFLIQFFVEGWIGLRTVVRLEELSQLKNQGSSSGFELATFRLVA